MTLNIPTPCNENWNKMTPTEQGAFCKKCALEVIDFSNKSSEEIKRTLLENNGKHFCGKIKKSQLDAINQDYSLWENQTVKTFQSKFLWACLIVFGMTFLGNSTSLYAQENNKIQTNTIAAGVGINNSEHHGLLGQLIVSEVYSEQEEKKISTLDQLEPSAKALSSNPTPPIAINSQELGWGNEEFLGEFICIEQSNETEVENPQIGNDKDIKLDTSFLNIIPETKKDLPIDLIEQEFVGTIVHPDRFLEFALDTTKTINETTTNNVTIKKVEIPFEAKLFPNPAADNINLQFESNENQKYSVLLYNTNGQLIEKVYEGVLPNGRQLFNINLKQFSKGIYFVQISDGHSNETLKINKAR